MDQLRLILLIIGVALIAGIFVWELYKKRVARRRREELFAHLQADERRPLGGESVLGDIGQADPFDVVERIQGRRSIDREPESPAADDGRFDHDDDEEVQVPKGYDIDEGFPAEDEEVTGTPQPTAVGAASAAAGASEIQARATLGDDDGLDRLSGLAARRDTPEQLDLAGLDLSAPARTADQGSERRATAARNGDPERRASDAPARSAEELHIVMTVMARRGEHFSGPALRQALEGAELFHGEMNIFHRHEKPSDPATPTLFSCANVLAPGDFEPERMDSLSSPGVAMFMRLPGPDHPTDAFQQMLDAAKSVADDLDGTLCDESRSTLTPQSINHLRERIADFRRRQMLKA